MIIETFQKLTANNYKTEHAINPEIDLMKIDDIKAYRLLDNSQNIPGTSICLDLPKASLRLNITRETVTADHLDGKDPEVIAMKRCKTVTGSALLVAVVTNNKYNIRIII